MDPLVIASLIEAGGGLLSGFMGGRSADNHIVPAGSLGESRPLPDQHLVYVANCFLVLLVIETSEAIHERRARQALWRFQKRLGQQGIVGGLA